jgi:hypothetical protein
MIALFDLVRRNFDKIPHSYKRYAELSKILDSEGVLVVNESDDHQKYICDMGAEGSVIMFDGAADKEIEYTNGEQVDMDGLLALKVDISSYSYIYQMGVNNPSELQILNAILHFDEDEFL